jgi:hypothetical protein
MSDKRDRRHGKKPPDVVIESGRWLRLGRKPGPAGSSPGKRGGKGPRDKTPAPGVSRSWFWRGPTRGTSQTGHDRKGSWFLGSGEGRGPKGDE